MMLNRIPYWLSLIIVATSGWAVGHHPQDFLTQIAGTKTEGLEIVQHYCVVCHAKKPLIPLGAPVIGDKVSWGARLKQRCEDLFAHVNEGVNQMPARGGCFECTDQQLWLAIEAMLPRNDCFIKNQKTK